MATGLDIDQQSKYVVEDLLGIGGFINENWQNICTRLEESELRVMKAIDEKRCAPDEEHILFLSESLPFVNGIVHVSSSLHSFDEGVNWVRQRLPDADPDSVLSALTFFYVVGKAKKLNVPNDIGMVNIAGVGSAARKEIWHHIVERVQKHLMPDASRMH